MSRTPIPDHLIHKSIEVAKNGKLFDEFVSLLGSIRDRESREITAANLLERIRRKVLKKGKVKLPFGLVIKAAD